MACPGPFIWYPCGEDGEGGSILHCSACGLITMTGNFFDDEHRDTEMMQEGLR